MSVEPKSNQTGAGLRSRASALEALRLVLEGRSLSEAIPAAFKGLEKRDEGLARAIVMSACKGFHSHEAILGDFLSKAPKKVPLIAILHLGLTEILDLQTADHAAVNSYVELAKRSKALQPYKNLINAVLRRAAREAESLKVRPLTDRLPPWLSASWQGAYGAEATRAMIEAMLVEPGLDLHLADPAVAPIVADDRNSFSPAPGFLRLSSAAGVEDLPGYSEGKWWVQDFSAQLPALLFGELAGKKVADFCCAPGGKAMQLAAQGARVSAYDVSEKRLERVRENFARTGLAATLEARDLTRNPPPETFDAVLLDAPCSATGTLRRNPDVLIHRRPSDIGNLVRLQRELIASSIECLRPGAQLVYSVCSLEPEEGEAQVAWALETFPQLVLRPISPSDLPFLPQAVAAEGWLRILPHMLKGPSTRLSGVDGFFAARFVLDSVEVS